MNWNRCGWTIVAMLGIVLTLAQSGCMHNSGEALQPAVQTPVACRRATAPIKLDGVLDEADWARAMVVKPFWRLADDTGLQPAADQTEVRLLWDNEYLYIGATMEDKDLTATFTKHDDQLWTDGDVFEFFVKPSADSYRYYEFHVNPLNTTLDLGFPRRGSTGWNLMVAFESGIKTAVKLDGTLNNPDDVDRGWTAEIAIPLAAFKGVKEAGEPKAGTVWKFAPCRYNYSVHLPAEMIAGCELSSAARDLKVRCFHNYENYLPLVFTP